MVMSVVVTYKEFQVKLKGKVGKFNDLFSYTISRETENE